MTKTQPFFILANPRSGSSLLRIICESHPNITVPPESGFLEWWYDKYKDWSLNDSKTNSKINDFCYDLMSSKKFETWNFNILRFKKQIDVLAPKNYSELIALVYLTFGELNNKEVKIWGDKNNYYINKLSLLNSLYPQAKYIYLIRDGRDVATSYLALKQLKTNSKYAPKLTCNIIEIAKEWNDNNSKLIAFFKSISPKNILIIRYEDLIQNLLKESKKITSFLDVPFDENMLYYYSINKLKSLEPNETLDWKKKTLEKPDKSNIGKYKKLLTKNEIELFNSIAKECLTTFNYGY